MVKDSIYWGSSVPEGWNGDWPEKIQTIPEKTEYKRTASNYQVIEYLTKLAWSNENMHIERMFISDLRRIAPYIVIAEPRVTTPEEAQESGKLIVYLQGNIHPSEAEGKEALLMVMRDILLGNKRHLLDNLIILVCPDFNPDGNDAFSVNNYTTICGSPQIQGLRHNAHDMDLNRDAIKMKSLNMQGLYRNILNTWDPKLSLDLHCMGRVQHGYAILYAPSYTPTAHPDPRGYTTDVLFPALREKIREDYGLESYTHADFDWENWPPKVWHAEKAGYSVEAKFIANAIGLRNRLSILTETPGHTGFEKRIYSCYAYILTLLEYANTHAKEIAKVCSDADEDTVKKVKEQAGPGLLRNWVQGDYEPHEELIDLYAYPKREDGYIPGTSIRRTGPRDGKPELFHGIEHWTKPVGLKEALVPRGYLFPEELMHIAEKLEDHGIKVEQLANPCTASGFDYEISEFRELEKGWIRLYQMTELEGSFRESKRDFPAGTYHVDMAQPLANLAFYCLEPEVGDGLVGWNYFNEYLKSEGAPEHKVLFPVFKYLTLSP